MFVRTSLVGLFVGLSAVSFLVSLTLGGADQAGFIAIHITLALSLAALMFWKNRLSDATFIFAAYLGLSHVLMPVLFAYDWSWARDSGDLLANWSLLYRGAIGVQLVLIGYALGVVFTDTVGGTSSRQRVEMLPPERARLLVRIFLLVAVMAWLVQFVRADMPMGVLIGQPVDRREMAFYGGVLIFALLFCGTLAYFCRLAAQQSGRLFTVTNVFFLLFVMWLHSIEGGRLMMTLPIIGTFLLGLVLNNAHRNSPTKSPFVMPSRLGFVTSIVIISLFSVAYSLYRIGDEDRMTWFANSEGYNPVLLGFGGMFSSVVTYYVSLDVFPEYFEYWNGGSYLYPILINIPSAIWTEKYSVIFSGSIFQNQVLGIDTLYDSSEGASGYGMMAELFINFGWYGLLPQGFIFGMGFNYMSRRAHRSDTTMFFSICYVFFVFFIVIYGIKASISAGVQVYFIHVFLLFVIPVFILNGLSRISAANRPAVHHAGH